MKKKADSKALKAKEKILDAAEQIVLDKSPSHLSLNAVAKKAGLSKGGLLYHFRSKDTLIKELIERHVKRIMDEKEKNRHLFSDSVVGEVQAHLHSLGQDHINKNKLNASLFAIAVHNLSLLEPIKNFHLESFTSLKDKHPDWMKIFSLRAAIYGMWYMGMFGILPLSDTDFQNVVGHIMAELEKV